MDTAMLELRMSEITHELINLQRVLRLGTVATLASLYLAHGRGYVPRTAVKKALALMNEVEHEDLNEELRVR